MSTRNGLGTNRIQRAHRFRRIRERLKMTQLELATLMGLSRTSIARYESATRRIHPSVAELLRRIAGERRVGWPR